VRIPMGYRGRGCCLGAQGLEYRDELKNIRF
jgi:hypothetical protein